MSFLKLTALVLLVSAVACVSTAHGQSASRSARVAVLSPGSQPIGALEALKEGLRERGYVEGKNLALEWRFAEGRNDRLPALATEIVALKPDVIVVVNTQAAQAVKNATSAIPVVFVRVSDPTRTGLVATLSKPGGNVTGVSNVADEMGGKRLEMLKAVLPQASRVTVLWNAGNPGVALILKDVEQSSTQLGVEVQNVGLRTAAELPSALEKVRASNAAALFVLDDLLITSLKREILEFAARSHLPVMTLYEEFVQGGALMSYGPSIEEMYRRTTGFVDRILKGAHPRDLPVEQPTKFEMVLNLKTAKALGIDLPANVVSRADKLVH
ncbi:MAG TPA: ABC transporter substrate-binding protein [Casimicrobiaceae bacterium]|nr:ABC transporter substrate-binding protein [Casimicrobiaceae bacterium]